MALFHNSAITGASGNQGGGAGYQISRSLRFNSSDSAYLSRTFTTPTGNTQWTWAGWVKRNKTAAVSDILFSANTSPGTDARVSFFLDDTFYYYDAAGGELKTAAVYRDFSAWLHVCFVYDSPHATSTDRLRLYINGIRVTAFGTASYPSQNAASIMNAAKLHKIGEFATVAGYYANMYLADVFFIDGQALTPSSFTEVSAVTGQLIPKQYTGTFTGNSFWLKFADNSAATATTLGKDSSGLGNNWTPNNLSVTAGAGNDSLVDTPTSYGTDTGAGGEVRGNYCTWNPLDILATALSDGNLKASGSTVVAGVSGSIGVASGKYYWEITAGSVYDVVGIWSVNSRVSGYPGGTSDSYGYFASSGNKFNSGNQSSYGSSYASGDVIGIALDLNAGSLAFYKNGTSQGTAFTGLSGGFRPAVRAGNDSAASTTHANFGQRPFAYTAPSGFKALCDTNLPAPTIAKGSTVMDVKLYTGNGSTQAISGLNFSPDFVWLKSRSNPASFFFHHLRDTVRGNTKVLYSNDTLAEGTDSAFASFDSAGFTVNSDLSQSTIPYVAWAWDAGSSTVTNTQGSITSQVRANASAGFSIVTFTGNGSTGTVGHGLGLSPAMIIQKPRNASGSWAVYHTSLGAGNAVWLNLTDASGSYPTVWNSTAPTSSVYSVGSYMGTSTYVAYCFAPVAGYSSFGSYTGNGSADGPFVFTGFRPRWILIKTSSGLTGWVILDAVRNTNNIANLQLFPHDAAAELSSPAYFACDFLSNGFKLRTADAASNASGATYIYAAFAESPFAYARAR